MLLPFTVFLLVSAAQAQSNLLPAAATCTGLIASDPPTMPAALSGAVKSTLKAYFVQARQFQNIWQKRQPTASETKAMSQVGQEAKAYLSKLLLVYGLPRDLELRSLLVQAVDDPATQACLGQQVLQTAATLEEKEQGASLIDRSLVSQAEKQLYGTLLQYQGTALMPLALQEPEGVDARRQAIGLPPLAQSIAQQQKLRPRPLAPKGLSRPVVIHEVCQPYITQAAANLPLSEQAWTELAVRAAELVQEDQASRLGKPGARDMGIVDAQSTAWLKEVLRKYGWPSANRSDEQLAFNAWLLAQHADRAPIFQECVLDLMKQQVTTPGEKRNLAYLTDRVLVGQGKEQVYGTQVMFDDVQGKASPRTLVDPQHVNQRRASVGLEPIEDYLKYFERPRP